MKLNELRFRLFFFVSLIFLALLNTTSLRYSSNTSLTPFLTPHQHFSLIANPHRREETQKGIDEFLDPGIIHESHSLYVAPAFIIPRKNNWPCRLVVDYQALNRITIPEASPLPHIEDTLQELGRGVKYFSKLDLKSGYHQFQISKEDQGKTAFVVSSGHYEFSVLPMGQQMDHRVFKKLCQIS